MGVISVNYETLALIVVMLFAAVGFMRGWLKEGVTTVLLVILIGLLYKPELVEPVLAIINTVLKLLRGIFVEGLRRFNTEAASAASSQPLGDIFVPENPYNFLIWTMIILIALSYAGTRIAMGDKSLSPLSRILGGLAGAVNGFIAISLFKEYLAGYFENLTTEQVAATMSLQSVGAPQEGLTVAVQNVPQQPFIQTAGPLLAIIAGVVIIILILSNVFKWNVK